MNNIDYSVYLVTDRDLLKGRKLTEVIEEAILGGTSIVQLREKYASSFEFYEVAKEVKKITDKSKEKINICVKIGLTLLGISNKIVQ